MVNIKIAFKRPFLSFKKLSMGMLLFLFPIINFFSFGYIIECARIQLKGKKDLPEWKNYGKLWIDGLLMFILSLVYWIPGLILFSIGIYQNVKSLNAAELYKMNNITILKYISLNVNLVFGIIFIMLGSYLLYAAIISWVKDEKFKSAFNLVYIFKKAFRLNYFKAWIIGHITIFFITFTLGLIPILGKAIQFIPHIILITLIAETFLEQK